MTTPRPVSTPRGLGALIRRVLRIAPTGMSTPRGAMRISPRAARKALEATATRHPQVASAHVRLYRGVTGYEVHCTVEVGSIAGWRRVAAEVQLLLRDALAQELHATGEVYVTARRTAVPPPPVDWLEA